MKLFVFIFVSVLGSSPRKLLRFEMVEEPPLNSSDVFALMDEIYPQIEKLVDSLVAGTAVNANSLDIELTQLSNVYDYDEDVSNIIYMDSRIIRWREAITLCILEGRETYLVLYEKFINILRIDNDPIMKGEGVSEFEITTVEVLQNGPLFLSAGLESLRSLNRLDFVNPQSPVITFQNSEAAGMGPRTEWIVNMLHQIFKPENKYFEFSDDRSILLKPNGKNFDFDDYRQIGRLIGMALREELQLGVSLTRGFISIVSGAIDNSEIELFWKEEDLEHFANVLKLKTQFVLDLEFPNSQRVLDSPAQVDEFIAATGRWKVFDSIFPQSEQIKNGIEDVSKSLSFESLMNPYLREINVMDLAKSAHYFPSEDGVFHDDEILWLWQILDDMEQDQLTLFLVFVSGSPFPPMNGFGSDWLRVVSDSTISENAFPQSQTCFRQIFLPKYTTKRNMKKRLVTAINMHLGIDRE